MGSVLQKFKLSGSSAILSFVVSIATVVGLGISILNFLILNNLSPVVSSLEKVDMRVQAIEKGVPFYATKDELKDYFAQSKQRDEDIIHRLDIISGRLDKIAFK